MSIDQMIAHVESQSARIRIQMRPVSAPGQCAICGNGQDPKGYVDPQLDFEFWGALIFCSECTAEMAAIYGFISPEVWEDLQGELAIANRNNEQLKEKIEKLEKVIESFNSLFNTHFGSVTGSSNFNTDEVPENPQPESKQPVAEPNIFTAGPDESESKTTKPIGI